MPEAPKKPNPMGVMMYVTRVIAGTPQSELAELLEVTRGVISKVERGVHKPNKQYIKQFCSIFSVKPEHLVQAGEGAAKRMTGQQLRKDKPKEELRLVS